MALSSDATQPVQYLVLGGGSVTAEYYLPALEAMGLHRSAVVVDPDESSLSELRGRFPMTRFSVGDYRSFLEGRRAEAGERIIVALPNHLHVQAAEQALDRSFHVLCEKPLSLKSTDCARLSNLAASTARVLKVAMSRRYLPSLMLAREILAAGEFGPIEAVEITCFLCSRSGRRARGYGCSLS
jgi:predicted dehydrogenase